MMKTVTSKALIAWISLTWRKTTSESLIVSVLWRPHCSVRSQHIFLVLTAAVVCCQTWPTLCMFHRTLPCGVCFLWGFGAPVTLLDGGCRRHAGVECGSRGRPGQMGLAFGHKRSVSERWYGFLPCLLKPVSNQSSQPDSGSDSNENQMVTREECEKQKRGESERRKLFLRWLWKRRECEEVRGWQQRTWKGVDLSLWLKSEVIKKATGLHKER